MKIKEKLMKAVRYGVYSFERLFHRLEFEGTENIPRSGAVILASNHPSYLDPVLITLAINRHIRFLSWFGLYKIPVLKWVLKSFNSIPVEPGKGHISISKALETLRGDEVIGIFPEGGRSTARTIQSPKRGVGVLAIESRAPIIPVAILGVDKVWPRGYVFPRLGKIKVKFLEPFRIDASKIKGIDSPHYITSHIASRINLHLASEKSGD